MSKILVGTSLWGGHNMHIMIELGLTNLPKKWQGTSPHVPIHSGGPETEVYAASETSTYLRRGWQRPSTFPFGPFACHIPALALFPAWEKTWFSLKFLCRRSQNTMTSHSIRRPHTQVSHCCPRIWLKKKYKKKFVIVKKYFYGPMILSLFVCNRGNIILCHGRLRSNLNQCKRGS